MSNVIEDRTVLEVGNVQYVACIVNDEYPSNPLTDWDQAVSFYVPNWGTGNTQRWINEQLDSTLPDTDLSRASSSLYERTMAASWYEDAPASDFLKLFRQSDPSGIYFIVQWNDSGYGDTIKFMDDDCDDDSGYAIAYRTAAQIRDDHMVKRITKQVREQAEHNIRADIKTQNAYFSGEVYMYELLRQVLDDDGETISSEEVNLWELGGDLSPTIYGYDGISELYDAAKVNAEYDHAAREATASHAMQSMDLFDAASYPEPTMSDVAGAYEARLNEQFAELGRVTRKLEREDATAWPECRICGNPIGSDTATRYGLEWEHMQCVTSSLTSSLAR